MFGLFGTIFSIFSLKIWFSTSAFQRLNEFQSGVSYKRVAYRKVCIILLALEEYVDDSPWVISGSTVG